MKKFNYNFLFSENEKDQVIKKKQLQTKTSYYIM